MKLSQILTRTLTEGIDYSGIPTEIVDRLKQFKPHEQEWGIKEYHNGENINNITDSITIYNNNIRDNRFSNILARHNPNYRNILNFTSRIIHAALIEYEELKAPKPSSRKLQEARRKWSIQEPPYSEMLVDNDKLRIIRVTRVDDTGSAAKIASDMSYKSGWCTVNTDTADDYLKRDDLYFILLDGGKYLCHVKSDQLMNFNDGPFRLSEDQYYLLSEYIPGIGLFVINQRSEIYKSAAIKYPMVAYNYARRVLGGERWPEAEPAIMRDPMAAYYYARYILKREWLEAEPVIMKDPRAAYNYALDVLKGNRWPEAEPVIMKDPWAAYDYAINILKRRWPEAEPFIMRNPLTACNYARYVLKGNRWPEAEPIIMRDPRAAYNYARYILGGKRWPEAEPIIMKDPDIAYDYVIDVLGGKRWPEAEPVIMKDAYAAYKYARYVLKGNRWPEAEPFNPIAKK